VRAGVMSTWTDASTSVVITISQSILLRIKNISGKSCREYQKYFRKKVVENIKNISEKNL
jgi:predicted DNA binding CopG/RHH family protein